METASHLAQVRLDAQELRLDGARELPVVQVDVTEVHEQRRLLRRLHRVHLVHVVQLRLAVIWHRRVGRLGGVRLCEGLQEFEEFLPQHRAQLLRALERRLLRALRLLPVILHGVHGCWIGRACDAPKANFGIAV